MKLIDVNLLLYATNERSPQHDQANAWFRELLAGGETVAMPWMVLIAFVRLTTNPRVLDQPLTSVAAIDITRGWHQHPYVTVPEPTNRHFDTLERLLAATATGGNLVSDAHLAALAIEHGATLCSADGDFARFPGLNWINPLAD